MERSRTKYDSFVVEHFAFRKEHLLPKEFIKTIPYSTRSVWRNQDYDSYHGAHLRTEQKQLFDLYELQHNRKQLQKALFALGKTWVTLSNIILPVLTQSKAAKLVILEEIQRLAVVIPLKTVLKLFKLSASAFYQQCYQIKIGCTHSPLSLCFKRHPLQISFKEVQSIQKLVNDPKCITWPISSLHAYAIRNRLLFISLSTFYNYCRALGIKRKKYPPVKYKPGCVAKFPNQFLHLDTTFWELSDKSKAAIVLVTDNFSKKIIGWNIQLEKSAKNVRTALHRATETITKIHPEILASKLISDGGSENNNALIEEFLQNHPKPSITKLIAKLDVSFSNNSVEAINKILKKFFRHHHPHTFSATVKCLEDFIYDYNNNRPHYSLNGLTPSEAYENRTFDELFPEVKNLALTARKQRIKANQSYSCGKC